MAAMIQALEEVALADISKLECEETPDETREEVCSVFLINYKSRKCYSILVIRIRSPDKLRKKYNLLIKLILIKKMNKRLNGIRFTNIIIKKITKNRYVSVFAFGNVGKKLTIKTSIHGESSSECIKKTEKFLLTKLLDKEYCVYD